MGNHNLENPYLRLNTTSPLGFWEIFSLAWDKPYGDLGSPATCMKGRARYIYTPVFVKDSRLTGIQIAGSLKEQLWAAKTTEYAQSMAGCILLATEKLIKLDGQNEGIPRDFAQLTGGHNFLTSHRRVRKLCAEPYF
jgi:hypothetical protein